MGRNLPAGDSDRILKRDDLFCEEPGRSGVGEDGRIDLRRAAGGGEYGFSTGDIGRGAGVSLKLGAALLLIDARIVYRVLAGTVRFCWM